MQMNNLVLMALFEFGRPGIVYTGKNGAKGLYVLVKWSYVTQPNEIILTFLSSQGIFRWRISDQNKNYDIELFKRHFTVQNLTRNAAQQ